MLNGLCHIAQAAGTLGISHLTVAVTRFHLRFDLINHATSAGRFDLGTDPPRRPAEAVADWCSRITRRFQSHAHCEVAQTKQDDFRRKVDDIAGRRSAEAELIVHRNLRSTLWLEQRAKRDPLHGLTELSTLGALRWATRGWWMEFAAGLHGVYRGLRLR